MALNLAAMLEYTYPGYKVARQWYSGDNCNMSVEPATLHMHDRTGAKVFGHHVLLCLITLASLCVSFQALYLALDIPKSLLLAADSRAHQQSLALRRICLATAA
jgi:hypothetical protein